MADEKYEGSIFEQLRRTDEQGNEFWTARDISRVLGYSEYRHFKPVLQKAREACKNSEQDLANHFEDILEMVKIGSGASRKLESVKLSRYACYLIVQNADPSKKIVALGQTYFAVQTRRQELTDEQAFQNLKTEQAKRLFLRNEMREHNKKLADAAKGAGVIEPRDYAIFQNHGYMGLYNGLDAKGIHRRKGLKKSQHILDHMGSTELAANLFRATQTEEKIRRENITGRENANLAHYEVGRKVRETIEELGGTMPEDLPAAPSIKPLQKSGSKPDKKLKGPAQDKSQED